MALASRRVKQYELDPTELDQKIELALGGITEVELTEQLHRSVKDIRPGTIVQARVDSVDEHTSLVVMDIGGKSEGAISLSEFGDELPKKGDIFEVYYAGLDEHDTANLSKRRLESERATWLSANRQRVRNTPIPSAAWSPPKRIRS